MGFPYHWQPPGDLCAAPKDLLWMFMAYMELWQNVIVCCCENVINQALLLHSGRRCFAATQA